MLDNQDLDAASDRAVDTAAPEQSAPGAASAEDPYGLKGLTFADLPTQPGDGVFTGVMRHMAAMGHPQLQAWAANDAAMRAGVSATPVRWDLDTAGQGRGSDQGNDPSAASQIKVADNSTPQTTPPTTDPAAEPSYKLAPSIKISDSLAAQAEPIAAAVGIATGRPMTITSTIRSPAGQAAAMFNNLEKGTLASYANKAAAQQITDAYTQAKSDGKSAADTVSAMQSQIAEQVANGVYVSKHMLDGAFDVRVKDYQGRVDPIMRAAVIEAAKAHGAMVYPESDHLHIQPR